MTNYDPTIVIGDSMAYMLGCADESFDAIVTDPPYNLGKGDWDTFKTDAHFYEWLKPYLMEAYRLLKPTGFLAAFAATNKARHVQAILEDDLGMIEQNWIVWHRVQGGNNGRVFTRRHETILLYSKTDNPSFDKEATKEPRQAANVRNYGGKTYDSKNMSDVWYIPGITSQSDERTDHPTQKPLALMKRLVSVCCPVDGVILDPFGGSGTTALAAMQLHRHSVYCEKDPAFADIAKDRFTVRTLIPA